MPNTDEPKVSTEEQTRSMDHIQDLYTVIIGLSLPVLAEAAMAVDKGARSVPVAWVWDVVKPEVMPMVLVFLFTVVPFYHGNNRHLDHVYVFHRRTDQEPSFVTLLVDLSFFLTSGLILFGMAWVVASPQLFFQAYLVLLITDVGWALSVWWQERQAFRSIRWWPRINALFGILVYVLAPPSLAASPWTRWTVPNDWAIYACLTVLVLSVVAVAGLRTWMWTWRVSVFGLVMIILIITLWLSPSLPGEPIRMGLLVLAAFTRSALDYGLHYTFYWPSLKKAPNFRHRDTARWGA